MGRVLRSLAVSTLAFALTSGSSIAVAGLMTEFPGSHDCQDTTHPCTKPAISSCCCLQGVPASLPASGDRTSELKSQACGAALAVLPSFTVSAAKLPTRVPLSTHRAGPPQSLPVLNASLLI